MAFLAGPLLGGLFGSQIIKAVAGKKKQAKPLVQQSPDDAADLAKRRDMVSRRRGSATNAILGAMGAESSTGKRQLGV